MSYVINNLKVNPELLSQQRQYLNHLLTDRDQPTEDDELLTGLINMMDQIADAIEVPELDLTEVIATEL